MENCGEGGTLKSQKHTLSAAWSIINQFILGNLPFCKDYFRDNIFEGNCQCLSQKKTKNQNKLKKKPQAPTWIQLHSSNIYADLIASLNLGKNLSVQFKIQPKYRKGFWIATAAALFQFNIQLTSQYQIFGVESVV